MIKIGDRYFDLKIIRKNNRNIYLRVKGEILEVTCPRSIPKEEIIKFVTSKADWINKTIDKRNDKKETSKLLVDEGLYYFGIKFPYVILEGKDDFKVYNGKIIIHCKDGTIDEALKVFYKENKKALMALIYEKQDKYLNIIKDYGYSDIPQYKTRMLKSMWGVNYTKKNLIVINERLIHFDEKCLEAVLWHEILHFVIPNHSKRFHEVLEYHMRDYKEIIKSIY